MKDPDVWESPPRLEKRQSTQKVQKANNYTNSAVNQNQVNKKQQIRSLPSKKKENGEKKTFLNDRYP